MADEPVVRARRFLGLVAARLVALEGAGARRSPGESRVLAEIGPTGCQLRALRRRLGLDAGYLSRLLRSLEGAGLVTVGPDTTDRRAKRVRPTRAGRAEQRALAQRAARAMTALLEPLDEGQRAQLLGAVTEVARLVVQPAVVLDAVRPSAPPARWCLERYTEELADRLPGGFDRARARPLEPRDLVPPAGVLVLASLWGDPVGCGGLRLHRDRTAEIKRMWVAPAVRGLGVGRRLLDELEARAAAAGVRVVRLDTHSALAEAVQLYRRSGYQPVPPFNDEVHADLWFEKALAVRGPDGMVGSVSQVAGSARLRSPSETPPARRGGSRAGGQSSG